MHAHLTAALAALAALLLAGCGATSSTAGVSPGLEPGPDGWRGNPIESSSTMPSVTLTDTAGGPYELAAETAGTPTLLFFGYTSCPDVCPIHMAAIASAMDEAGTDHDALDVVFVSVDPERDTPGVVRDWLDDFDSRFVGLTGERARIERALEELDLPDPVVEGDHPRTEGDLIGHPAQVIGLDAAGEVRRLWPFGTRRADWVADLPRIVEEWA